MLLGRALWAFGLAGAGSIALVAFALLGPALPAPAAWTIAYVAVGLGMSALAGFGWIVLTLPPGAPIRTRGLRVASAVGALTLAILVLRTGLAG